MTPQRCNMTISTDEGFVEDGQIRLRGAVTLPENATVYVVVPQGGVTQAAHVYSPRLARPADASQFVREVLELPADADV